MSRTDPLSPNRTGLAEPQPSCSGTSIPTPAPILKRILNAPVEESPSITVVPYDLSIRPVLSPTAPTHKTNVTDPYSKPPYNTTIRLVTNPAVTRNHQHQQQVKLPTLAIPTLQQKDILDNKALLPIRKATHSNREHPSSSKTETASSEDSFQNTTSLPVKNVINPYNHHFKSLTEPTVTPGVTSSLQNDQRSQIPKPASTHDNIFKKPASIKNVSKQYSQPPYDTTIELIKNPGATCRHKMQQQSSSNPASLLKQSSIQEKNDVDPYSQPPYDTTVKLIKKRKCCNHHVNRKPPNKYKIVRRSIFDNSAPLPYDISSGSYDPDTTCRHIQRLLSRVPVPEGSLRIFRTIYTPVDSETFYQKAAKYIGQRSDHVHPPSKLPCPEQTLKPKMQTPIPIRELMPPPAPKPKPKPSTKPKRKPKTQQVPASTKIVMPTLVSKLPPMITSTPTSLLSRKIPNIAQESTPTTALATIPALIPISLASTLTRTTTPSLTSSQEIRPTLPPIPTQLSLPIVQPSSYITIEISNDNVIEISTSNMIENSKDDIVEISPADIIDSSNCNIMEVPLCDREISFNERVITLTDHKIPLSNGNIPVNDNEIPLSENEILLGNCEIPVRDSEIPVSESKIPLSESEIPSSNSEIPVSDNEIPLSNSDTEVSDNEILLSENEILLSENEILLGNSDSEIPVSESEFPLSNSEIPVSNSEIPLSESETPPRDIEISCSDIKISPSDIEVPVHDSIILPSDIEIPLVDSKILPTNIKISPNNIVRPPYYNSIHPNDIEISLSDSEIPPGEIEKSFNDIHISASDSDIPYSNVVEIPFEEIIEVSGDDSEDIDEKPNTKILFGEIIEILSDGNEDIDEKPNTEIPFEEIYEIASDDNEDTDEKPNAKMIFEEIIEISSDESQDLVEKPVIVIENKNDVENLPLPTHDETVHKIKKETRWDDCKEVQMDTSDIN